MDDSLGDSFSSVVAATNSNLARLSRTMATTATVLASPYGEISPRAMAELTGPHFHRRLFTLSKTPTEVVRGSFKSSNGRHLDRVRMLSELPDEMLRDVPAPQSKYTLWQGFEAERTTDNSDNTDSGNSANLCEINKELAAFELRDIDRQIAELQNTRRLVFDRMARVERTERDLELTTRPSLQQFYAAGDLIKSYSHVGAPKNAIIAGDTLSDVGLNPTQAQAPPITGVAFDRPFGTLAAASDANISVVDLAAVDQSQGAVLNHGPARITCLSIEANNHVLAAGKDDSQIDLWNVSRAQAKVPSSLSGHSGLISALHLTSKSLVSAADDHTVRYWDVGSGRCIGTLDVLTYGTVRALQHFDAALATGSTDGIVRLWDLRAGQVVRELKGGHELGVTALEFDDTHLVSGGADGSVKVWNIGSGDVVDAVRYDGAIRSIDFDESKIVTATDCDTAARVWDRKKRLNWACGYGASALTTMHYEQGYLVDGREDGSVNVWAC